MTSPLLESTSPARAPIGVGQQLGKYRLIREIGKGGMGTVYEGIHTDIGQHAALKVLNPNMMDDEVTIARFFDEARLLSMVEHPSMVRIYDLERGSDGSSYIAMELLHGETLQKRLASMQTSKGQSPKRGLPLLVALRIIRQIASGMAAVHEKGIIHRDLKPENVFLVPDSEAVGSERAKLLDFGIAKLAGGDSNREDAPQRTAAGISVGTPSYMSPEQCEAQGGVTEHADVYSLGVMAYEILEGQRPFQSDSLGGLLRQHLLMPPPNLTIQGPPALNQLLQRMMEKSPQHRPKMSEVVEQIERLNAGPLSGQVPVIRAMPVEVDSAKQETVVGPIAITKKVEASALQKHPSGASPGQKVNGKRRFRVGVVGLLILGLTGVSLYFFSRHSVPPVANLASVVTPQAIDKPPSEIVSPPPSPRPNKPTEDKPTTSLPSRDPVMPASKTATAIRPPGKNEKQDRVGLFRDRPKKRLGVR